MITVTFDGLRMKVEGHALFDEHGKDIVCAGASTLAFTLAEQMKRYEDNGIASLKLSIDKGVMRVDTVSNDETCAIAYDIIKTGYKLLAAKYPDHITLVDIG